MIFTFIENIEFIEKFDKLIKIEQKGEIAIQKFVEELKSMKIFDELNQNINDSPEDNYNKFASLLNHAREKHLPIKLVKYNKKRHKKSCWMTNGILESINTKDKLYKIFIQADKTNVDRFNTLKSDYQAYRARLRKTIREAKRMFYATNHMKKTCGVISDTLKRNRKSKSQAEFIYENHVIRDTDEMANHFDDYFINIARTLSQTHSFNNYLNNNSMLRFKFQPVDQNHISQLIDKLKNKACYGHDNISTKLIK